MPKKILVGMFLSLIFASQAYAGWTSGGGEILRDSQNPWFLPINTPTVKYCIEMDDKNFGASKVEARKAIVQALAFWKKQFASTANSVSIGSYSAVLAQHDFQEVPCQYEDIKFQFGTLSAEQFACLKDPTKLVASTVRTSYDTKQLQGKGFIYVSPSRGPLKMKAKDLIDNPWGQNGGVLLVPTLIHELGHTFGIPHNQDIFVMKEDFPEKLVTSTPNNFEANTWTNLVTSGMIDDIQLFQFTGTTYVSAMMGCKSFENSPYVDVSEKFFGFSYNDFNCYGYTMKDYQFNILGYRDESTNAATVLGTATIDPNAVVAPLMTSLNRSLVEFFFPEDQTVFNQSGVSLAGKKLTIVMYSTGTKLKGDYVSADGKTKRKVLIEVLPFGLMTVGGLMDGELFYDVLTGY